MSRHRAPVVPRWLTATVTAPTGALIAEVFYLLAPFFDPNGWDALWMLLAGYATWWLAIWVLLYAVGVVLHWSSTSRRVDQWAAEDVTIERVLELVGGHR